MQCKYDKKRIIQIGITLACLFSLLVLPVHAASSNYTIPELGLTISIPTEYDVFTLDMTSNDPLLSDYGTTKDDLDGNAWDPLALKASTA